MPIIAKDKKSEFTPAPEGLWPAVCCDVVDLGMVTSQWGTSHQVEIRWQLEEDDPKAKPPRPYMVVRRFRNSLHEKSNLRPMLESWRGRKFRAEELEGFDLEKLLGANCQVQIIHDIKTGNSVFAKVQAIVPPGKGAPKLSVRGDYIRKCERDHRAELESQPDGTEDDGDYSTPF